MGSEARGVAVLNGCDAEKDRPAWGCGRVRWFGSLAFVFLLLLALTAHARAAACPNEARRAETNSLSLPECRAYELVSEGDGQGVGVTGVSAVAGTGSAAIFSAPVFGEPTNLASLVDPNLARRSSDGWKVTSMPPSPDYFVGNNFGNYWPAADLSSVLWSKATPGQQERGEVEWQVARSDGGVTAASPLLKPLLEGQRGGFIYVSPGAGASLDRYVLSSSNHAVALLPGEALVAPGHTNLYVVSGAQSGAPTLGLVNQNAGGEQIGGSCGAALGGGFSPGKPGVGAVSRDGMSIYFSARPEEPAAGSGGCTDSAPVRIFRSLATPLGSSEVVDVSQSECTRESPAPPCSDQTGDDVYQAASADGSRAFLTTSRQLANSDTDLTTDLYEYDAAASPGSRLVQVSAGEAGPEHTVGSGAEVLGILDSAADGSHVYFVATGVLSGANAAGEAPVAGADNLYAYARGGDQGGGSTQFIAALPAADAALWGGASPGAAKSAYALPSTATAGESTAGDGHFLLFVTTAPLRPGEDADSEADLYRYDDLTEELRCLSCLGEGPFPVSIAKRGIGESSADYVEKNQVASTDVSKVLFSTKEPLPGTGDTNEQYDLYLWTPQGVSLLSGGTGSVGISGQALETPFGYLSADAEDAYFMTTAPVIPADRDGDRKDVYTAHLDGGFPQPAAAESCATVLACHQAPSPEPATAPPASAVHAGPGNQSVPPPKCARGAVRKKGRCQPKRHRSHRAKHRHHHRAKHRHHRRGKRGRADHTNRRNDR